MRWVVAGLAGIGATVALLVGIGHRQPEPHRWRVGQRWGANGLILAVDNHGDIDRVASLDGRPTVPFGGRVEAPPVAGEPIPSLAEPSFADVVPPADDVPFDICPAVSPALVSELMPRAVLRPAGLGRCVWTADPHGMYIAVTTVPGAWDRVRGLAGALVASVGGVVTVTAVGGSLGATVTARSGRTTVLLRYDDRYPNRIVLGLLDRLAAGVARWTAAAA